MSITSDLRAYADKAAGKAQAQLNDVTGQANEYVGKYRDNVSDIAKKAADAVTDLRQSAEKAINFDAIRTAIEPYVAQVKGYGSSVTDRADALLAELKKDPRVGKFVETAESVSKDVVETVQQRVVVPVRGLANRGTAAKPARTSSPSPAAKAAKPAATKPATTKPASRPAAKATARKAPAKRAPKA